MKNIDKGLGYIAIAAISIAILVVTGEASWAAAVALTGFMLIN